MEWWLVTKQNPASGQPAAFVPLVLPVNELLALQFTDVSEMLARITYM